MSAGAWRGGERKIESMGGGWIDWVCVCEGEISERPKRGVGGGKNEGDGCFSTQGQGIGEENIYVGANEKSVGRV